MLFLQSLRQPSAATSPYTGEALFSPPGRQLQRLLICQCQKRLCVTFDKISVSLIKSVLVKKKGRGILTTSRPFPVGRYSQFHTALPQAPVGSYSFRCFQSRAGCCRCAARASPSEVTIAVKLILPILQKTNYTVHNKPLLPFAAKNSWATCIRRSPNKITA